MIKKSTLLKVISVISSLLLFAGCQPKVENVHNTACNFSQGPCLKKAKNREYSLQISPFEVPQEQELTIELNFPEELLLKSAHIEGVNMYMGKIPVIIESQGKGLATGISFLGSCSEPKMRWRLIAYFTDEQKNQTMQIFHLKTEQH